MDYKGMARVARAFKIEVGEFRAQGAPAVLIAVSGVVLTAGLTRAVNQNAATLPDVFRQAKNLIDSIRAERATPRSAEALER